jgi:hypothetical protein
VHRDAAGNVVQRNIEGAELDAIIAKVGELTVNEKK